MAPTVIQSSLTLLNNSSANPATVNTTALGSGTQAGSTVILLVSIAATITGGGGTTPVITPPTGFTALTPGGWLGAQSTPNMYACGMANVAGGLTTWAIQFGTPPSFNWFLSVVAIEIRGCSIALDQSAVQSLTTSTLTLTTTGVVPKAAGEIILVWYGVDAINPASMTGPSGYTAIQSQNAASTEPIWSWWNPTTAGSAPAPSVTWTTSGGNAGLAMLVLSGLGTGALLAAA